MGTTATTEKSEVLVSRALWLDRIDQSFQSAVTKARRALKRAPGGRRKWIFYQAAFGAFKPHRPICEMIDALVEAGAPEEDVEALSYFFVRYADALYAKKRTEPTASVKETLKLAITSDTDEVNAAAAAIAEPDSVASLERLIEATVRDNRSNESVLNVCRRKVGALHLRLT
jgi:hypothetical protein